MGGGPAAGDRRRLRVGAALSLSGRHARFGRQAALGLAAWRSLEACTDLPDLVVADDRSDPRTLEDVLGAMAAETDVLLGPYSTHLMRTAGRVAEQADLLLWNHGGSGDDVEAAHPGHIVSVLTPASRYAEPFLRRLARDPERAELWIAQGTGGFGRQVAAGARRSAHALGIGTVRLVDAGRLLDARPPATTEVPPRWDLFCAGSFDEDVETVRWARRLRHRPRTTGAVAAGVSAFGRAVGDPVGVFGVGQWAPHRATSATLGPAEGDFLAAYAELTADPPDYPAVQAAAAAALAVHCVRRAGGAAREALWPVAAGLRAETLFGAFDIDPRTGVQIGHRTVLTRWTEAGRVHA
jgi:ABC-type branched-subunit amino acid transport system substrate-binding protein